MKTTELMIGDWANLTYKNGYGETISKNFQVTQIRESAFRNEALEAWSDNGNMGNNINGIPLTPEILEKNGWKWRTKYDIKSLKLFSKDGHSLMTLTYGNKISVGGKYVEINYVHELQHALRLCGLDDLADDFQI